MKIAIVGAPDSVEKVYNVLEQHNSEVEFIKCIEEKVENTPKLIEKIQNEVDGIYVTGVGIYSLIKKKLKIPVAYTSRKFPSIAKAFWDLKNDYVDFGSLKLGIDIVDKNSLKDVLTEFNIPLESYNLQEYVKSKSEEEYLKEYERLLKNDKINCIMTAFGHIYFYFKKMDVPVYRLQASGIEIKEKFQSLVRDIEFVKNEESSLGVQIIKIHGEGISEFLIDDAEIILENFSKEIQGDYKKLDNHEYMLIGTKKMLKNKDIIWILKKALMEFIEQNEEINIGIGIGYGESILYAEKNARKALGLSLEKKEFQIFASEGKSIRGPLFEQKEIEYRDQVNEEIYKIAKNAGISSNYLCKIKAIQSKYDKKEFSSKELAEYLEISERSANRIIKSTLENGFGKLIEFENSIKAGRPRRIIKFNF
ncbi:hypothetical protein [Cetobacterium ceti]